MSIPFSPIWNRNVYNYYHLPIPLLHLELNFAQMFIKKNKKIVLDASDSIKLFQRRLRPSVRSEMLALLWRIVWKWHKN